MAILYITYDGVLEPLGESQVVTYLEGLARSYEIALLSFEKPHDLTDRARVDAMRARLTHSRIAWTPLTYRKRPPVLSTLLDVVSGIRRARALCREHNVGVIHARSYVSSLIALGARGVSGAMFLFDMRGFWVDEKVEAGHWPAGGWLYRVGKWWERRFFREADAIVSLTQAGVDTFASLGYVIAPSVPVAVIPTCVDLQRFAPRPKDAQLLRQFGLEGAVVVGSTGTISNWYLRRETLTYLGRFAAARADVRVLFVTREDHDALRRDAVAAGVPADRLVLTKAGFDEMPALTALFDAGVFFIRPALSKRGSAATKLAEFLGCGVPVVINDGVGDSGSIVRSDHVGVVLDALDDVSMDGSFDAVQTMLDDVGMAGRCRAAAEMRFDVAKGIARYGELYRMLLARRASAAV